MAVDKAGEFFGAVLIVAGLVGTMIGGFAATAWQKRNPAGYAWTLGLSVLAAVPLAFGTCLTESTFWYMSFLATDRFVSTSSKAVLGNFANHSFLLQKSIWCWKICTRQYRWRTPMTQSAWFANAAEDLSNLFRAR